MPHLRQRSDGVPKELWVFGLQRRMHIRYLERNCRQKNHQDTSRHPFEKRKDRKNKRFKSKLGKEFDAVLMLGPDGKIVFEFEKNPSRKG